MAQLAGIDVVYDFRAADMEAGVHGTPMLPVYHRALAEEEAEAFAYLAARSVKKLPLSFPGTRGGRQPVTGGRLAGVPRR